MVGGSRKPVARGVGEESWVAPDPARGQHQPQYKSRERSPWCAQFAPLGTSPSSVFFTASSSQFSFSRLGQGSEQRNRGLMASNYVDTVAEEGRFFHGHGHGHHHHHHHSTTPTGAAASPKTMRRSSSSASSNHSHGATGNKCVCAPATHAGSFKCRLHRSSSHGHPASPPSPATSAAPPPAAATSSSRTVAAQ